MPNQCCNILSVKGSDTEILRFAQTVAGKINGTDVLLSFASILPPPYPENCTPALTTRKSEWCTENWGTKSEPTSTSDLSMAEIVNGAPLITAWKCGVEFLTAWTPPTEFVWAVAKQFPSLVFTLRYLEISCAFGGTEIYVKTVLQEARDYCPNLNVEEYNSFASDHFGFDLSEQEAKHDTVLS